MVTGRPLHGCQHGHRGRVTIIGSLLEAAAGVAEERRQAVANAYTARRVVEAAR